jgi:hypothetical protein
MLEPLARGRTEQRGIVQKGDVDPAFISSVGMHDLVAASWQYHVDRVLEPGDDELVLDLADSQQVWSLHSSR